MMFGKNRGTNETWRHIPHGSVGVELGVWKGDSSVKFLRRAKHLHLVDSWSPAAYSNSDEHGGYEAYLDRYAKLVGSRNPDDFVKFYDAIYSGVVRRFRFVWLRNRKVTIHRMQTQDWLDTFTEQLDWIYVDASHSYNGCLQDLQKSLKLIKSGGILLGDDFSDEKPGVKKAVVNFANEHNLEIDNFYADQYKIVVP